MKVTILKEFRDKDNFAKLYKVGEEIDFEKDRAAYLAELGLAKVSENKPGPKTKEE